MYLLNKKKLKQEFKSYEDLSEKLDYENGKTIFERPYNRILDADVFVCPDGLKDRLNSKGYDNCCFDVTDLLLDLIIVGEKAFSNTVRIIVAIMIRGLTLEDEPIACWSIEDIRKYAQRYFDGDPVYLHKDTVNEALKDTVFIDEGDRGFSLNVEQLAQMTYNVKP